MKDKYFFLVLVAVLFVSTRTNAQVWEAVGPATGVSAGAVGRLNLLCDYQNDLLVGYYDVAAAKGNVQKYVGGAWSYPGGASTGITTTFATYNSTAADNQGVIYFTSQNSGLEVRKFEGSAWTQLTNATTTAINYQASAVSPDNVLFVASGENSGTIKRYVNGVWEQVGNSGFFGGTPFYLDMAIGTNGKVYISFNNSSSIKVYEINTNASATDLWQPVGGTAAIASASSSENYNSSLTIDSSNNLYVCYVTGSAGGNKLNAKKFDGTTWTQLGPENFSSGKVQHTSIAVASNGTVYTAASVWENDNYLKNYVMAYNATADTWSLAADGYISEGQATYNSLAADGLGNIYLAYSDSFLGKLVVKKLIPTTVVAPQSVAVSISGGAASTISTDNGTLQLTASVLPAGANQAVTWSVTSGTEFATVSANGLVTATNNGTVTVRATAADGTVYGEITIVISGQVIPVTAVTVTVQDNAPATITTDGETLQLVAAVTPANATNTAVVWSITSDSEFATVSTNGIVAATNNGTVTVRATAADGTVYGEITIVISGQVIPVTAVTVTVQDNAPAAITTDGGTLQLVATVTPADATNTAVVWSITSGSEFATVSAGGIVTAAANGTVTVRATAADGSVYGEITIVISGQVIPVTAVTVTIQDNAPATITTDGGTLQLIATITPADATNTAVVWSITSGGEFATVSASGIVTAVANGAVTVRATAADGTVYGEIEVIVDIILGLDDVHDLRYSIYPNPVSDLLTIDTAFAVKEVSLFNMAGQQVYKGNRNTISLKDKEQGVYILKVVFENGKTISDKILKN